jgi:hypothetical protein
MTGPIWLRQIRATVFVLMGFVLLGFGVFSLMSGIWSPIWKPLLFVAMTIVGSFNVIVGIAVVRQTILQPKL